MGIGQVLAAARLSMVVDTKEGKTTETGGRGVEGRGTTGAKKQQDNTHLSKVMLVLLIGLLLVLFITRNKYCQ